MNRSIANRTALHIQEYHPLPLPPPVPLPLHYNYNYKNNNYYNNNNYYHYYDDDYKSYNCSYNYSYNCHYATLHYNYIQLQSQLQLQLNYTTATTTTTTTLGYNMLPLHYTTPHYIQQLSTATTPKSTTPTTFRAINGFALPSIHHNNSPLL